MTFLLGMATSTLGVICADTRMNLQTVGGTWRRNDSGVMGFSLRDGSVHEVPATKRKMRRFRWGWAAGSASSGLLTAAVFERLAEINEPSEICSLVSRVVRLRGDALRAEFTGSSSDDELVIIYLYDAAGSFELRQCVVGRRQGGPRPKRPDYALSLPPDIDERVTAQIDQRVRGELFIPLDAPGLWELIRRIADVLYAVHYESETVSDHMDLAMLVRDAASSVMVLELHGRSSEIRTAVDEMIAGEITASI